MKTASGAQGGRTLLEIALFLFFFACMAMLLLGRLYALEEESERLAVELTIRNIRTGIQLAVGEKMMQGRDDRIVELLQKSPFDFLGRTPQGAWSYDAANHRLNYVPRLPAAFNSRPNLQWHVESVSYADGRVYALRLVEENLHANAQ